MKRIFLIVEQGRPFGFLDDDLGRATGNGERSEVQPGAPIVAQHHHLHLVKSRPVGDFIGVDKEKVIRHVPRVNQPVIIAAVRFACPNCRPPVHVELPKEDRACRRRGFPNAVPCLCPGSSHYVASAQDGFLAVGGLVDDIEAIIPRIVLVKNDRLRQSVGCGRPAVNVHDNIPGHVPLVRTDRIAHFLQRRFSRVDMVFGLDRRCRQSR